MANKGGPEIADQLWLPNPAFPGEQTMIYRDSRTRELVALSMARQRRVLKIRAILTDQSLPLNSTLEEILAFQPRNRIRLPDGSFSLWKHYGGTRAVFHDLCADENGYLSAIEVDVSAVLPELALGYARAAVNQLLDSLTASMPHPLVIQRLELLSPEDNWTVLAYQVTMPHQSLSDLKRFGGIGPARWFAGVEAILREGLTNPSPYYGMMLAYRGFEGAKRLRREIAAFVKKHDVQAPDLTPMKIDRTEMAQHGFRKEALALETFEELIEYYRTLRDAAAHFFVGSRGKAARQHLQFSSTLAHTYAKVASMMLTYLRRDLAYLKGYYVKHIAPLTNVGMILPMESVRERYMVVCPDDEATAPPDEFN
jgi:hypothetical protein